MKKPAYLKLTSTSLIASLLIPVGCSTTQVNQTQIDDSSLRVPSAEKVAKNQKQKLVSSVQRRRRPVNLGNKKPLEAIRYFYSKARAEDDTKEKEPEVTSPWVDPIDETAINSCLTAACGPANEYWSAYNVIARPGFKIGDVSPAVEKFWSDELKTQSDAFYKRKAALLLSQADRFEAAIKKGTSVKNHPFLPFLSFMKVFALLNQNSAKYLKVAGPGKIVFNEYAAKQDATLSAAQLTIMKLVFERYFIPMISIYINSNPLDNSLVTRLKTKYPDMTLADAQKKDAQTLLDQIAKITKVIGAPLAKSIFDESQKVDLTKAATGAELTAAESDSYTDAATGVDMMNVVFFDQDVVQALKAIPYDPVAELVKVVSEGGIAIPRVIAKVLVDNSDALNTQTATVCKINLSASMELNASPLRYRKMLEATKSIKTAAKTVVAKLVDPEGLDSATKQIDAVQFSQPSSNEARIQMVRDGAAAEDRTLKSNEAAMADKTPAGDQMVILMNLLQEGKTPLERIKDAGSTALGDACGKLPIDTASDFTLTSQGRISVSWYSANYPEFGVSVMAHEMGHMVSTIVRNEQTFSGRTNARFSEIRNCVANRNPYLVEPKSIADMEQSTWVEEDWADRFSSLVMDELKRTGDQWASDHSLGCALDKIEDGAFTDNKLAPKSGDTHSSGLYRTLMVGTDRGTLPNQCKSLLIYAAKANRKVQCN